MSQQINLFNPIFLKKNTYFSAATMLQTAGLLMLGVFAITIYTSLQTASFVKTADIVNIQLRDAEAKVGKVRANAIEPQKNRQIENSILKTETELASKQKILNLLQKSDFGNTKGYSAYLQAFARQIPNGVWLTGLSIDGAGSDIGLQGRALKPELLPVYVNRLKQENSLQGKSFSSLQMQMPSVDADKQDAGATALLKSKTQVPFIEFSLRSSGSIDAADGVGVKLK